MSESVNSKPGVSLSGSLLPGELTALFTVIGICIVGAKVLSFFRLLLSLFVIGGTSVGHFLSGSLLKLFLLIVT